MYRNNTSNAVARWQQKGRICLWSYKNRPKPGLNMACDDAGTAFLVDLLTHLYDDKQTKKRTLLLDQNVDQLACGTGFSCRLKVQGWEKLIIHKSEVHDEFSVKIDPSRKIVSIYLGLGAAFELQEYLNEVSCHNEINLHVTELPVQFNCFYLWWFLKKSTGIRANASKPV